MAMFKVMLLMAFMAMTQCTAIEDKPSLAAIFGLGPNGRNPVSSGPSLNNLPFDLNFDIGTSGISKQPSNIGSGADVMSLMNFGMRRPAVPGTPSFGNLGSKPIRNPLIDNPSIPNIGKGLGGVGGQSIRYLNTVNGGMRNPNMLPIPESIYNTLAAPRLTSVAGVLGAPHQFIGSPFEDIPDLSTFGF